MSKWCKGVVQIKCSLDVLRKALIGIHPTWEKFLEVDASGNLPMYRYRPTGKGDDVIGNGYHLVVPGGRQGNIAPNGKPGIPSRSLNNDWGFKKVNDGWEITYGDYGSGGAGELTGNLQQSIEGRLAYMKSKITAQQMGVDNISETNNGGKTVVDFKISKANAKKFLQMSS